MLADYASHICSILEKRLHTLAGDRGGYVGSFAKE